jgi:hypothetical protein
MELPENFYRLVEKPGYLKNILYGDTDSIFLSVPMKDANNLPTEARWKLAEHSSNQINKLIIEFVTQTLLPRCNINPQHNRTFFKTEMLIDSAMFLDVKKNYAYTLSCKEGVVLNPPKTEYTGIQVVKSDAAKMTQELLRSMIENVMLNTEIKRSDRQKELMMIVQKFHNQFIEDVKDYKFQDIGLPGKWSKKEIFINGMKIYNFLINEEVFNLGSSAKFLYCNFNDHNIIKRAVGEMKSPGICVPYEYNTEVIKDKMEQAQIFVDQKLQWEKLFTTTCHRVIDLAKSEAKSFNSLI